MIATNPVHDLLAGLCTAIPGAGSCVVDATGSLECAFGERAGLDALAQGDLLPLEAVQRCGTVVALPRGGALAVAVPQSCAHLLPWVEATLQTLAQKAQLECDMESMNQSSLQLLEQVSQLSETLPRLSACQTIADVADGVLEACVVAASVERAVYLHLDPRTGACEPLVYVANAGNGRAVRRVWPGERTLDAEQGIVAAALASSDRSVVRQVSPGASRPGSPEALAHREVLGVQVGYDADGRRVCLGALLLFDKMRTSYDLDEHLGSEEGQVAASFASMLGAVLGARQTAELGKEMRMAQTIQSQILPARPAVVPGFDLAGSCRNSGAVGGDYFDYVPMADGRTLAVVADVSGHNLASGMVMVGARATLRTLAGAHTCGARVFEALAQGMFDDLTRTERFITAAGIVLRPQDLAVDVINAGHAEVMHYVARERTVRTVVGAGPILGFVPGARYEAQSLVLEPGDCLLLYTDGVTESTNGEGEMFGEDRLAEILGQTAKFGARAVVDAVLSAVRQFEGPQGRGDDVTVVAVRAMPRQGVGL